MLKNIFSSTARIKLLKFFFSHEEDEYHVREIVRQTGEQINSVRRELENLRSIGLISMRQKLNRKYYKINHEFILYGELASMLKKGVSFEPSFKKIFTKSGKVDLLIMCGDFVGDEDNQADMLVVGDILEDQVVEILDSEVPGGSDAVSFALLSTADFEYRLLKKDKFILDILSGNDNIALLNKFKGKI